MQPQLEHNNMPEHIQNWTLASFLSGFFNLIYNTFFNNHLLEKLADFTLSDWVAIAGVVGMVFSLLMQRHYIRRRDAREAEQHEWRRKEHELELEGRAEDD